MSIGSALCGICSQRGKPALKSHEFWQWASWLGRQSEQDPVGVASWAALAGELGLASRQGPREHSQGGPDGAIWFSLGRDEPNTHRLIGPHEADMRPTWGAPQPTSTL